MERKTLSLVYYNLGCMELYFIHYCTHVSTIWMDVTIPWDFIFMMILVNWMVAPIPWIFSYSLHHPDGCTHVVDSCLDLRYVICICILDLQVSWQCMSSSLQELVKHLSHRSSLCLLALGGICYTRIWHTSCTSPWHTMKLLKRDHHAVYLLRYLAHILHRTLIGKCLELSLKK